MKLAFCFVIVVDKQDDRVTPRGTEQTANASENAEALQKGVAESGALPTSKFTVNSDLLQIIDAWPNLPVTIQKAILMIVQGRDAGSNSEY